MVNTNMKNTATCIISACCFAAVAGDNGRYQFEFPGYDDTPMIPGSSYRVHQKDRPSPPEVIPFTDQSAIPSDAIILFDGTGLNAFESNEWNIVDGHLTAQKGTLKTSQSFGDCQFHIEWRAPNPPKGNPGSMGNSGIFFMERYEFQVYDSYSSKIYADGSAASIYGQTPPLINATMPPGQWQTYDIVFTAPVFENGTLKKPATVTALHNGVLVHLNTEILGPTGHKHIKTYTPHPDKLPISFQSHHSPVQFRNIWIRPLTPAR